MNFVKVFIVAALIALAHATIDCVNLLSLKPLKAI